MPDFKILVRATNWVGDAVMSLPALRAIRARYPDAEIVVVAKPWVADLYSREHFADRVIFYTPRTLAEKLQFAWKLRLEHFDHAILLQNAFEAALVARVAGIPRRTGYNRDGRGWLLTQPVEVPKKGEIPAHERYYYLELLRRAGIIHEIPAVEWIRLEGLSDRKDNVVGISPGAAYGTAKRWLPESFAETAVRLAREFGASVAVFGTRDERALCEQVAAMIADRAIEVKNYAGTTSLAEFIDLAAACRVFITNDSGAMHIASAAGTPMVAVFGATDHVGTGPTGPVARIVRQPVDCAPCLKRECPIDHRCMTRVTPDIVVIAAREVAS